MQKQNICLAAGLFALLACEPKGKSSLKETWNDANNPVTMMAVNNEFETDFTKLPIEGRPSKIPWSDHYWPTYHGGISYRWGDAKTKQLNNAVQSSSDQQFAGQLDDNERLQKLRTAVLGYTPYTKAQLTALRKDERTRLISTLSPAEKYDIYRGAYSYPTVKSERDRTDILSTLRTVPDGESFIPNPEYSPGNKIPTWFGICHAWAPATILFEEPGPLTLKSKDGFDVPMAASDIKALLSHIIDVDGSQQRTRGFMAERCNNDLGKDAEDELKAIVDQLKVGSLETINAQVEALLNLNKFDLPTSLAIASHFYNFAASQEEAQIAFQKLFERLQNRLKAGSDLRSKLGESYAKSRHNFPSAGQAGGIDRVSLKKAVAAAVRTPACNDTNAGAFHLVLTNVMGIQQKSFGVDVTRDAEVWNQAAASFTSKVLQEFSGDQISVESAPGTVKEILIETVFLYTTEEMPAWERFGDNVSLQKHHVPAGDIYQDGDRRYRAFRYRIELDKENRIIGGSWVSDARLDFIWGTGNFIFSKEFSDIENIYYQSI